jgi:hypothetical protein
MRECMPMFYMPASDSIQLRFTLKRRCSPSQARLIGLFCSLASEMMKASSGCSLWADIGHSDSMQPSWQHPLTLYRSPHICLVSNPPPPARLVTLLRVLFPTFHPQLQPHILLLAIPNAMSTQSPSLLLLVHLVIPTSLGHRATPILVSIPVSCSALDAWRHFLDPKMN